MVGIRYRGEMLDSKALNFNFGGGPTPKLMVVP